MKKMGSLHDAIPDELLIPVWLCVSLYAGFVGYLIVSAFRKAKGVN